MTEKIQKKNKLQPTIREIAGRIHKEEKRARMEKRRKQRQQKYDLLAC